MSIRQVWRVLVNGWWLILPTVLLSIISALVLTARQTPIFQTSTSLVVSPNQAISSSNDFLRGLDLISRREGILATYIAITRSSTIRGAVYDALDLIPSQRRYLNVASELLPSTNVIKITVSGDDPLIVQQVANLIGERSTNYIKQLYEAYDMKTLDPAFLPSSPVGPKKLQNVVLAFIMGSVGGVVLAFVLENLRMTQERVAAVSVIDEDTGIHNEYYFMQRLGEELSRAERYQRPLSVVLTDIQDLDAIKDMRLPRLRNQVLRHVGLFLKSNLHEEDVVVRYKGDQFAILLPEMTGNRAKELIHRLQNRLMWSIFEAGDSEFKLHLSASSGIVSWDFGEISREEMIARAHLALEHAREDGSDKVHLLGEEEETGEEAFLAMD